MKQLIWYIGFMLFIVLNVLEFDKSAYKATYGGCQITRIVDYFPGSVLGCAIYKPRWGNDK